MTDKERMQIVEKHAKALLTELRAEGQGCVGVAGGVVLDCEGTKKNQCHCFFVLDADVVNPDGKTVSFDAFVTDVATTMVSQLEEDNWQQADGTKLVR